MPSSDGMRINVPVTRPGLAPPQVEILAAQMNLGGGGSGKMDFMTNKKSKRLYMVRLPREVLALLNGRHFVGITEINPFWFDVLIKMPAFSQGGRYRGVHDGHDCAIFWDTSLIRPTDASATPQRVHKVFLASEIPRDSDERAFNWRTFMFVEFEVVDSPHVVFIVANTHSISGSQKGKDGEKKVTFISGDKKVFDNKKSMIAMRAMQKGLSYAYVPSLVAGRTAVCLVFLGDWNTHQDRMPDNAHLAANKARAISATPVVMTADGTLERDHVVIFSENRYWQAKVQERVAPSIYKALESCISRKPGGHWPLFFTFSAEFPDPATEPPSPLDHPPHPPMLPDTASTRMMVHNEVKHLQDESWDARQNGRPSISIPAPPLLSICVLNLLCQVRPGQTQTFLVESCSRGYFSVGRFPIFAFADFCLLTNVALRTFACYLHCFHYLKNVE